MNKKTFSMTRILIDLGKCGLEAEDVQKTDSSMRALKDTAPSVGLQMASPSPTPLLFLFPLLRATAAPRQRPLASEIQFRFSMRASFPKKTYQDQAEYLGVQHINIREITALLDVLN
jgi:hypothetical protein